MAKKIMQDAIIAINPSATFQVNGEDVYENIKWLFGFAPIAKADIDAKLIEIQSAEDAAIAKKEADKASAKAKLIAGEALTEDEADTIVL